MLEIKPSFGQADLELNAQPSGDNALVKLNKNGAGNSSAVRFKNLGVVTWDMGTLNDDHLKIKHVPTNTTILDVDDATRNIGIFTNDFTEAVNISGNVSAFGAFISKSANAGFQFQDRTNNAYGGWNWYANNGKANLFRYSTGDVLTIDQLGNVGIGTTSPGSKLDVLGNVNFTGNVGASGASSGFRFDDRTLGAANGWQWYASGGKAYLYDQLNSANRLVIDNTGNVGIGTSTPSVSLNVVSSSTTGTAFIVNNSSGYGLRVNNFGTGIGLFAGSVSSSPAISAENVGSGSSIYATKTNSGIGAALEVDGPIKVSGNKSAFVLTVDATNLISNNIVDIDNANSNNDPNAMIFFTSLSNNNAPISVFYNAGNGHWQMGINFYKVSGAVTVSYKNQNENNASTLVATYAVVQFSIGDKFNILVIKQ
jgi:hypothetical protein